MSNRETNKRRIKIGLTIFFGFAVLLALLTMIDFDGLYAKFTDPVTLEGPEYDDEEFYEPDFNTNILDDPLYLGLDRTLTWVEDGVSEKLFDNNYQKYHEEGQLVHDYFESLINGNAAAYNQLFSAQYKKKHGVQQEFPMQRIYEMKAEVLSSTPIDGGGKNLVIKLSYKIQGNDGTVRRDVLSDSCVPIDIKVFVSAAGNAEIQSVSHYYIGDRIENPKMPIILAVVLISIPVVLIIAFAVLVIWILRRKKKA